jgi:hypothetical protein
MVATRDYILFCLSKEHSESWITKNIKRQTQVEAAPLASP